MIVADVNVLVYAFRVESPQHRSCNQWLLRALREPEEFAVVDHCLAGFLRIVTHPRIYADPAPTEVAWSFVRRLRDAANARPVRAERSTWELLQRWALADAGLRGNLVPDAYLAALAVSHGARLATCDRGFARFPGLAVLDPTAGG